MPSKSDAIKILDYWFAIEFLGQDSYDVCTEESKHTRELAKFYKENISEREKRKQITVVEDVDGSKEIYSIVADQARKCEMTTWGNLTFFLGKVKRQKCIEKLAKEFDIELTQAEINVEDIPILSFQCNSEGVYIEHSLSLSTIVWALSKVSKRDGNMQISDILSEQAYSETLDELENIFFPPDCRVAEDDDGKPRSENEKQQNENKPEEDEKNDYSDDEEEIPLFAVDAITTKTISTIFAQLAEEYERYIEEKSFECKNVIKYQLFRDTKAKDRYNDDNYYGLSHHFFISDLRMVKDEIKEDRSISDNNMLSDLISYICAPSERTVERRRYDFVKPKNEEQFFLELSEILNVRNAPIGKWPSRYSPALMQQIAINLAVSDHTNGIFDEKGKIFSVNGPPGTGKTTLLKEIIANNIVKKAILLSKYSIPDDAFTGVRFQHGENNGAYSKYYPKWFRFKDDEIAEYGVLVTSCNNAAVENVTVELPKESEMLCNLQAKTDGNPSDSAVMQERLAEIRKLFSTAEAEESIEAYSRDSKRHGFYPEIYFTGYAKNFFGNDNEVFGAWGLVAAPLGKKSNVSGFYYDVLNPVLQDFMISNDTIQNRLPKYQKAKEDFCAQLKKVESLQAKIGIDGDRFVQAYRDQENYAKKEQESLIDITKIERRLVDFENEAVNKQEAIERAMAEHRRHEEECRIIRVRVETLEEKLEETESQELEYRRNAVNAEKSVSFLTKIFRRGKYDSALELAKTYRMRADECVKVAVNVKNSLSDENDILMRATLDKQNISSQIDEMNDEICDFENKKHLLQKNRSEIKEYIERCRRGKIDATKKTEEIVSKYLSADEMHKAGVLSKEYATELLDKDEEVSTLAQISNPWFTEEYNLEREKLLFLALQLTKEFLLSSKACRQNLSLLGQYWGLKTESGTEKIIFHPTDKESMMGSLFNTLFLLTPVVSSTFASIGRLLRDIKEPGAIGTLVIDEAGQAQPQMAVGALFRSRRAIIVGDPRQIEPVVTDDLKLLKNAYSDPVLASYKDKSLSVQVCADIINPFGTFYENGTDYPEWVGSPLLVHRRCIAPMYEISNSISYHGMMKQQTAAPSEEKKKSFIEGQSKWFEIGGSEKGNGDHYVSEQGDVVCKMVEKAFKKANPPNLYIISPFSSVVRGIRKALTDYAKKKKELALSKTYSDWCYSNIGTVHKFQGKEANEVIFLLGCDKNVRDRYAVKGFVNSNIVNVAATRAKYRFYIIGCIEVWDNNQYIREAKALIDKYGELSSSQ